jgi:hypothetical protein
MSGWNKKTGFYELTYSQAQYWFRRNDLPEECIASKGKKYLDVIAFILENHGLKFVSHHSAWLEVNCNSAGEIWEALSGLPSNQEIVSYHDRGRPNNKGK